MYPKDDRFSSTSYLLKEPMYEDEIAVIELKNELISESKCEVRRKQINFEEGNVYSGIKDVWVTEKQEEDNQRREDDGVESVLKQQWRRYLNSLSIFWKMCGEPKESENLKNLLYGGRQLQRDGLRKSDNAETKAVESESFESDNINPVVEHWERKFYVLNVFQEMYNGTKGYKDFYIPTSERRVQ